MQSANVLQQCKSRSVFAEAGNNIDTCSANNPCCAPVQQSTIISVVSPAILMSRPDRVSLMSLLMVAAWSQLRNSMFTDSNAMCKQDAQVHKKSSACAFDVCVCAPACKTAGTCGTCVTIEEQSSCHEHENLSQAARVLVQAFAEEPVHTCSQKDEASNCMCAYVFLCPTRVQECTNHVCVGVHASVRMRACVRVCTCVCICMCVQV
eukprot:1160894-Pelagomonas_calceolata.AAC.12